MRGALASLVLALAAPAAAQEADAPRVVATSPAFGETVAPGDLLMTVTFDRPMQPGWSFVTHDGLAFPRPVANPVLSADKLTVGVAVRLEPDTQYGLMLNSARFTNFKDLQGRPAIPYRLTFKTAGAAAPQKP